MWQIAKAESQMTVDDDYNVPDYRPDIVKIIKEQGQLKIEEVKPTAGAAWIKGKLIFRVLYRSDQETGKISCLKGELPFQEKLNMEGLSEYDQVRAWGEIEDLNLRVIHSRKLNVRAVLVLHGVAEGTKQQEVADGIVEQNDCMQLQKEMEISQQLFAKHDICRQKSEIILPSSKPNIREILWKSIELRNVGSKFDDTGIHMTGEVMLSVMYQEEEEPDRIQWYETTIPLECKTELELGNAASNPNVYYQVRIEDSLKELEVRQDYDGEERMLVLELQLHLFIRVWEEVKCCILQDAYSLKRKLMPVTEKLQLEHMLMKNDAICKLIEQMELEENQERILQICSCEGAAYLEHIQIRPDGVFVEGTLTVHLLYITTDDQMPVGATTKLYSFEQLIELPATQYPVRIEQDCTMVQLSASMVDQSHAEIKAVIGVSVLAFACEDVMRITEIKEMPFDMGEVQKQPGLVGYIAKKGDTLWDVAKEYHTTVENIMRNNQKKDNSLQDGERILIVKEVGNS